MVQEVTEFVIKKLQQLGVCRCFLTLPSGLLFVLNVRIHFKCNPNEVWLIRLSAFQKSAVNMTLKNIFLKVDYVGILIKKPHRSKLY